MSKIFNDTTRNLYLARSLYDCIEDNNIMAVKKLLKENQANANIILPDKGITPFHLAIGCGDEHIAEEITKVILEYGGDPNIRSVDYLTPVHISCAWGRLSILKLLLKFGGDFKLKDEEGRTALDFAKIENYLDIVDYIQNYDLNTQNNFDAANNIENKDLEVQNNSLKLEKCSNDRNLFENSILEKSRDKILNISEVSNDINLENSYLYVSSVESDHNIYSRESGILTIHDNTQENILNERINSKSSNNSEYVTCDSVNIFEKNLNTSLITLDLSKSEKDSIISEDVSLKNEKVLNLEEYEYVDEEKGIKLIEKRILVNSQDNNDLNSDTSSLHSVINYDTDTIRKELTILGENPGPITKTTKRIYLKRLKKLRKIAILEVASKPNNNLKVYSVELQKTLSNPNWVSDLTQYKELENLLVTQFSKNCDKKHWREGNTKTSFTYLLLDPRISQNLPLRAQNLNPEEIWNTFLQSIFYVGKGKRSRPYFHLYEAVNFWNKGLRVNKDNKKINYILNIWNNNYGVVCLHIFQNVMPVEAYTREAAMINALKLQNLCNCKSGDFYGVCAVWPERKKRLLGVYLLHRAMLILLNEGERQLMPNDIGK